MDLDTLLKEFELDKPQKTTFTPPNSRPRTDDLDAALAEFELDRDLNHTCLKNSLNHLDSNNLNRGSNSLERNSFNNLDKKIRKKCYQPLCNESKCLGCDFKVLLFKDKEWKGVDYLFFRNHYPTLGQLETRLVSKKGHTAACCQCSWTGQAQNKWTCRGHSS